MCSVKSKMTECFLVGSLCNIHNAVSVSFKAILSVFTVLFQLGCGSIPDRDLFVSAIAPRLTSSCN
jgi:hypothetical protein